MSLAMKVFGHPLHIMLIHFPSALFPMELVCYALYYYTGQASFAQAALYAMTGGVALGWLAAIFGGMDMLKIPSDKIEIMKKALLHGCINVTVITVYTVLAYSLFKKYPDLPKATITLLIVKFCVVGFMIIANYMGGSLILKDKIGIEK